MSFSILSNLLEFLDRTPLLFKMRPIELNSHVLVSGSIHTANGVALPGAAAVLCTFDGTHFLDQTPHPRSADCLEATATAPRGSFAFALDSRRSARKHLLLLRNNNSMGLCHIFMLEGPHISSWNLGPFSIPQQSSGADSPAPEEAKIAACAGRIECGCAAWTGQSPAREISSIPLSFEAESTNNRSGALQEDSSICDARENGTDAKPHTATTPPSIMPTPSTIKFISAHPPTLQALPLLGFFVLCTSILVMRLLSNRKSARHHPMNRTDIRRRLLSMIEEETPGLIQVLALDDGEAN